MLRTRICSVAVLLGTALVFFSFQAMSVRGGAQSVPFASAGPVSLGSDPVEVTLRPQGSPIESTLDRLSGEDRVYLILRDLRIAAQPGAVYQVHWGATDTAPLMGTFNFFSVLPGETAPDRSDPRTMRSFDITRLLPQIRSRIGEDTTLTITPSGPIADGAEPVVGSVELVIGH